MSVPSTRIVFLFRVATGFKLVPAGYHYFTLETRHLTQLQPYTYPIHHITPTVTHFTVCVFATTFRPSSVF
jgi:hypothetical protein